ncbi:hypothetical protein B0H63DRAFT_488332 [Podospora didyma]|uniref:Uncharacterized protein n=1 Tax=Podospora didyma TaxID=330526 RepID=A0AAE0N3S5_9PEZI|nr:hypothetical protein B0H63DRAFT_488332 [Podospora didyma]
MKLLITLVALITATIAAPSDKVYPAPCGRSVPSGRCSTEPSCIRKGGFFVGRDCPFYGAGDIGCCYDIPE